MSKTAFIFPGQGSQYAGMGKDFYDRFEIAREYYALADKTLGYNITNVSHSGDEEKLKQTINTQPAIFILSVIISKLLQSNGIIPDYVTGHSLGEYSALTAAGVLSFTDALSIIKVRASEMQRACTENPGAMAAIIGIGSDAVNKICMNIYPPETVQAANYNSPIQTVISGTPEGIDEAIKAASNAGAMIVKKLPVSGAFHSNLMSSVTRPLTKQLGNCRFKDTEIPVIPNVTALPETSGVLLMKHLITQITSPVRWHETINALVLNGVTHFVEIGPGKVLKGLVRSINKQVTISNIGTVEELNEFRKK